MLTAVRHGGALCGRLAACASTVHQPAASVHHHKERHDIERFIGLRRSNMRKPNRHWDVKWREQRRKKYLNIVVPDHGKISRGEYLPEEIRHMMLKSGVRPVDLMPERPWTKEREVHIDTLGVVADPFVPPTDEGRASIWTKERYSEFAEYGKRRMHDKWHQRRLRKHEGMADFTEADFALEAERLYCDAMAALCAGDDHKMRLLMAQLAWQKTTDFVGSGTLRWSLAERVSPPAVVRLRVMDFPEKSGNDFAQVTVRMHNKQTLALYDQFGRLRMGSEEEPVAVLEYIVFERHVASAHGRWRVLDMIVPEQVHQRTPVVNTLKLVNIEDKVKQKVEQRRKYINKMDYLFGRQG